MPFWRHRLLLRARAMFSKTHDRELRDELQTHLQLLEEHYSSQGAGADEARRLAYRQFGNPTRWQEISHDLFSLRWLEEARRDLSHAVRLMRLAPGFTLVAVLSLAVGIGGTTAAFSLLDGLFLRRLPVPSPDGLVIVAATRPDISAFVSMGGMPPGAFKGSDGISMREFNKLTEASTAIAAQFLWGGPTIFRLSGSDAETEVTAERATAGYFSTLGVPFEAGRPFGPGDMRSGERVVVISHRLWLTRFNGNTTAIGSALTLKPERGDAITATIVGVADRRFTGIDVGTRADVWLPFEPGTSSATPRDLQWWGGYRMMARLAPGVSLDAARGEVDAIFRQMLEQSSAEFSAQLSPAQRDLFAGQRLSVLPGGHGFGAVRTQYLGPAVILTASAMMLLLIACANVASLLLARGVAREAELSVRLAMGGARARIVRQLLYESLALALAGGGAGLAIAFAAVGMLRQAPPTGAELPLALDSRALAAALAISLGSAVAFGLLPALTLTRLNISSMFKGAHRSSSGTRWSLKDALVATQIALSVVLLFGAGLLARSYMNLTRVDTGFDRQNIVLVTLDRQVDLGQALERLSAIPGVEAASAWRAGMLRPGMQTVFPIYVDGVEADASDAERTSLSTSVAPRLLETIGIGLLSGRSFTADDAQRNVAIVTAAWARHFAGTVDAVGMTYRASPRANAMRFEIIGVTEDIKYQSIRETPPLVMFRPFAANTRLAEFVVRTSTTPGVLAGHVRTAAASLDPGLKLTKIASMGDVVGATITRDRVLASFAGFLSVLATALAGVGLYGTLAYTLRRRTSEIGLRMALGAAPHDIVRAIVPRVASVVGTGVVAGLLGAFLASRSIASLLFGLTPADAPTTIAAVVTLAAAAACATYLPVRRASRVDPMVALRYE